MKNARLALIALAVALVAACEAPQPTQPSLDLAPRLNDDELCKNGGVMGSHGKCIPPDSIPLP